MSDEKPKHKPQHKHTLSEVLKSLQDLIRTDLISGKPPPASKPADRRPTPSPEEADSFNEAVEHLDRIITERIIEPTERVPQEPPAPRLPDETLEIEWEGEPEADTPIEESAETSLEIEEVSSTDLAGIDEGIELAPPPETGPAQAPVPEPVFEEASKPPESGTPDEPAPGPEPPPPEIAPDVPPREPDVQRAFDFTLPLERPHAAPADEGSDTENAAADLLMLETPAAVSPERPELTSRPATTDHETATAPVELSEQREPRADEPPAPEAIPTHVVEYTGSSKTDAAADGSVTGAGPGTVDANPEADTNAVNARSKSDKSRKEPSVADAGTGLSLDQDSGPPGDEIPVLQDVADLAAPAAAPLPDASQARDIAIRVIARLNIERRKSGEKPLDIKTIERLQQYLADALTKRALNKPK